MCIRAGPRFYYIFYFKLNFSCVCNIKIWLFQILCLNKIKVCFHVKRLCIAYQLQLICNKYWIWPLTLLHCLILAHCEFEFETPDVDHKLKRRKLCCHVKPNRLEEGIGIYKRI